MATITELSQLDLNGTYSYADYLTWQLNERIELIKGKVMLMSPAPNTQHQRISSKLHLSIGYYLKDKKCEIFSAPFDVKLYNRSKSILTNKEVYNVVQPDLCVICDKTKITHRGCDGAPEFIIEILSKGNSRREIEFKYQLYAENGVKEYWLIYPYEQSINQFLLNEETNNYQLIAMYPDTGIISPVLFPELQINLENIFAE
ncbi:MAG: Uma2 family endonuclease [Methylococcaceae bacterium]